MLSGQANWYWPRPADKPPIPPHAPPTPALIAEAMESQRLWLSRHSDEKVVHFRLPTLHPTKPFGAGFELLELGPRRAKRGIKELGCSALVFFSPFPDDGQRILDVLLRIGIGVGVKNLSLGRNHIGNAVGKGRAHNRNVERGVIGLDDRKAGVRAHREFVASRCTSILSAPGNRNKSPLLREALVSRIALAVGLDHRQAPCPLRDDKTAKIGRMKRAKLQGRRLQSIRLRHSLLHDQDPKRTLSSRCAEPIPSLLSEPE